MGIERFYVPDAIVFLVRPGELMFFDDAMEIILATGGADYTDLTVRPHHLAVQIETRFRVLPQCALSNEPLEVFLSFGIDLRRVNVSGGRQINLRFTNVQETEGIAASYLAGFLRRHYIVRQLADAGSELGLRTQ